MEKIRILCAPASTAGKVWYALHVAMLGMATFVGVFCALIALIICSESSASRLTPVWPDPSPPSAQPELMKHPWPLAIAAGLCAIPNLALVVSGLMFDRAVLRQRWSAPVLRAKAHIATLLTAAVGCTVTGAALLSIILRDKDLGHALDVVVFWVAMYA
jgi:hypothetical protein